MPALSDGGISLAILTGGMIFLDLVAKNGEFRYMVFGIRNNLCLFARIRYKMTSKMIANGRFWMGDCLLDRAVIRETGKTAVFPRSSGSVTPDGPSLNGKNPCYDPRSGFVPDGYRRRFYHQSWGCSGFVVRGEMHLVHLSVGDTPPRGSPGLQNMSYSRKTKSFVIRYSHKAPRSADSA